MSEKHPLRSVCADCGIGVVWDKESLVWRHDLPPGTNVRHMPRVSKFTWAGKRRYDLVSQRRIDALEDALKKAAWALGVCSDHTSFDIEMPDGEEVGLWELAKEIKTLLEADDPFTEKGQG